ncbi:YihY/virulence factor BrkB family protein [Bacteroidales bacterium OttesenSCG-928-K03]|nr:YihY/virulence factor BrkB family protein [Odoribacter sp. OttesenSCG-928-L07]MDL2238640.1 YihY/virulence factor BrkB family protein [Bacteroidales bacterium OttesenSCG-928-L14]MDL2240275.1 YihY/virulence factor BrkB family protein [Bacteroidales bacterium OttesenSCG-928-K22]MDL2242708.1 YihY/virulence factor BrkB family protein [Bacteroidales bacterium OttesenSCG-928-K03]
MREKVDLWLQLENSKFFKRYIKRAKHRYPKWCQGARYYDVLRNFINGMHYGFLDSRASAIAFQFFIALFPFVLALATLIPYFSIDMEVIMETFSNIFNFEATSYLMSMFEESFSRPKIGLTSISFLILLFFASKGISTMMKSLNNSYQDVLDRPWWVMRIISLIFAVIIFVLLVIVVIILSYQTAFVKNFVDASTFGGQVVVWGFRLLKLALLMFFSITIISFIYYYSPGGTKKVFKLWSPGAFIAVVIIGIGAYIFRTYIVNFGSYNYFYGSLGAMIIFLVLLKVCAIALIIGFEFNAAIWTAKHNLKSVKQIPDATGDKN